MGCTRPYPVLLSFSSRFFLISLPLPNHFHLFLISNFIFPNIGAQQVIPLENNAWIVTKKEILKILFCKIEQGWEGDSTLSSLFTLPPPPPLALSSLTQGSIPSFSSLPSSLSSLSSPVTSSPSLPAFRHMSSLSTPLSSSPSTPSLQLSSLHSPSPPGTPTSPRKPGLLLILYYYYYYYD